jgi:SCP-2 sterol transfer family
MPTKEVTAAPLILKQPPQVYQIQIFNVYLQTMPFADKDFPSSQAFDLIDQVLQDQDTRNDMMKSAKAVFAFDLTSPDGSKQVPTQNSSEDTDIWKESWYIDLKEEGKVGKGDKKADVRLVMKDEIFQQLAEGKANAQYLPVLFKPVFDTSLDLYSCKGSSRSCSYINVADLCRSKEY